MFHVQSLSSSEYSQDTELLHRDSVVVVMKKNYVVNVWSYVGKMLVNLWFR